MGNQIRNGLLLTGGGARAAYQAGVIKAVADIYGKRENPFPIITGISAGAINGVCLAAYADDFQIAAQRLWDLWANLRTTDIYRADTLTLGRIALRWLIDLIFGGLKRRSRSTYLLDSSPLRSFLSREIDLERMRANLKNGHLRAVAFTATNFKTGTAITFVEGQDDIEDWVRTTRMSIRDRLTVDHVLASSALPIFFSPVRLRESFYGDGGIRLSTPLSPPIHLGADKVFAVGIRHPRSEQKVAELNFNEKMTTVSMGDVAGALLNSIFLDSLETDLERMERINRTLDMIPADVRAAHPNKLRVIPVLAVRPSQDLGQLASKHFKDFPPTLQYMLRGLGASSSRGSDLLSYLAFEGVFARELMRIGYDDVMARADEVRAFLK